MPASRAILIDILTQGLNPNKPHKHLTRDGHLTHPPTLSKDNTDVPSTIFEVISSKEDEVKHENIVVDTIVTTSEIQAQVTENEAVHEEIVKSEHEPEIESKTAKKNPKKKETETKKS